MPVFFNVNLGNSKDKEIRVMSILGPAEQLQLMMLVRLAQPEPQTQHLLTNEASSYKKELKFLYEETKHKQKVQRNQEKNLTGNKPVHYGKSSTPIQKRKGKF